MLARYAIIIAARTADPIRRVLGDRNRPMAFELISPFLNPRQSDQYHSRQTWASSELRTRLSTERPSKCERNDCGGSTAGVGTGIDRSPCVPFRTLIYSYSVRRQ